MAVTASDILHSAEAFRRCYPNWPSAEPGPATFSERNQRLRDSLAGPGRIEVLEPGTDPETERLYRLERADYTEG